MSIQEILDGLEFARGDPTSTWGSVRAKMGHPEPFDLKYVAIGNEDCGKSKYRGRHTYRIWKIICVRCFTGSLLTEHKGFIFRITFSHIFFTIFCIGQRSVPI